METIGSPPSDLVSLTVTGVDVKDSLRDTSSPLPRGKKAPSGSMFSVREPGRSTSLSVRGTFRGAPLGFGTKTSERPLALSHSAPERVSSFPGWGASPPHRGVRGPAASAALFRFYPGAASSGSLDRLLGVR